MRDFRIALVQHCSVAGDVRGNVQQVVRWARKAARAGAALVCFPELNLTGHAGHPAMVAHAQSVPDGPCVTRLMELAAELKMYICAGIAEDERGVFYNTQFIVGPEGFVGKQRKVHLSRDEYFYFRGGTALPVFDLPLGRVGIVICFDNEVPEVSRCLAVGGAELLLCPHAARFGKWPADAKGRRQAVEGQKQHWRLVHCCRAYDNGCYVALCNTAGRSAVGLRGVEANHAGGCMVIGPSGQVVTESRSRDIRDEMVLADLKAEAVTQRRMQPCFNLRTRRVEVFGRLVESSE